LVYTGKSAACAALQSAIAAVDAKRIVPTFFTSYPFIVRSAQRYPTRAVSRGRAADANEDSVSRR
jgi:hypothetical protein